MFRCLDHPAAASSAVASCHAGFPWHKQLADTGSCCCPGLKLLSACDRRKENWHSQPSEGKLSTVNLMSICWPLPLPSCRDVFDAVVCFEEKVMEQVVEGEAA
jgi:hypothetical protein